MQDDVVARLSCFSPATAGLARDLGEKRQFSGAWPGFAPRALKQLKQEAAAATID
ncbi:hypothetical protein [Sulfitobacter sp. D35]|uniref:hypothetical protein n=1 Tax=Sulfitobacter sp. D35 TaxID=3083252 RepID=UPI00296E6765|nr:hypothetical protein [Sulfitobacter sp. D35]